MEQLYPNINETMVKKLYGFDIDENVKKSWTRRKISVSKKTYDSYFSLSKNYISRISISFQFLVDDFWDKSLYLTNI